MTASADGIVRLWDASTGQVVRELNWREIPDAFAARDDRQCLELTNSSQRMNEVGMRVECARLLVPRCLTRGELEGAFLNVAPPDWCVRLEKWPYHTADWKLWLKYRDEKKAPPLPDAPVWEGWVAEQSSPAGK